MRSDSFMEVASSCSQPKIDRNIYFSGESYENNHSNYSSEHHLFEETTASHDTSWNHSNYSSEQHVFEETDADASHDTSRYQVLVSRHQHDSRMKFPSYSSSTTNILAANKSFVTKCKYSFGYWSNKDRCKAEAAKFNTRATFIKNSVSAYNSAYKHGWLDDICSHMISPIHPSGKSTNHIAIMNSDLFSVDRILE